MSLNNTCNHVFKSTFQFKQQVKHVFEKMVIQKQATTFNIYYSIQTTSQHEFEQLAINKTITCCKIECSIQTTNEKWF